MKARKIISRKIHALQDLDKYDNPVDGSKIINCCFPDCGCDEARLCMAKNGANYCSRVLNIEKKFNF